MIPAPISLKPRIQEKAMRAMFAARKQVFVDLLGWDLPVLEDRFEIDQFDTAAARYLILLGPEGEHRASARLLPTTAPHILGTLYPHLCDGKVPRDTSIMEISRFCLDRNQDAASRLSSRNQLVTALVDHALREGIGLYTGVASSAGWHRFFASAGIVSRWESLQATRVRRLGPSPSRSMPARGRALSGQVSTRRLRSS